MKTFKFVKHPIEAEIELTSGEMIKLKACYPTPDEMHKHIAKESKGGVGAVAEILADVFNQDVEIFLHKVQAPQLSALYNWFWAEVKKGAEQVPPGSAGK